eukprot:g46604.t1
MIRAYDVVLLLLSLVWVSCFVAVSISLYGRRELYPICLREKTIFLTLGILLAVFPFTTCIKGILLLVGVEASTVVADCIVRESSSVSSLSSPMTHHHTPSPSPRRASHIEVSSLEFLDQRNVWARYHCCVRNGSVLAQLWVLAIIELLLAFTLPARYHFSLELLEAGTICVLLLLASLCARRLYRFERDNLGIKKELSAVFVSYLFWIIGSFVLLGRNEGEGVELYLVWQIWSLSLSSVLLYLSFLSPLLRAVEVAPPEPHLTTALTPFSSRPAFREFLQQPLFVEAFMGFLIKEFAEENLLFALDVLQLQDDRMLQRWPVASAEEKLNLAEFIQLIGETYLRQDSFNVVNISHGARAKAVDKLEELGLLEGKVTGEEIISAKQLISVQRAFDDALEEVMSMMLATSPRFLETEAFKQARQSVYKQGAQPGINMRQASNSSVLSRDSSRHLSKERQASQASRREESSPVRSGCRLSDPMGVGRLWMRNKQSDIPPFASTSTIWTPRKDNQQGQRQNKKIKEHPQVLPQSTLADLSAHHVSSSPSSSPSLGDKRTFTTAPIAPIALSSFAYPVSESQMS